MGAVCPGDIYRETGIWEYGRSERQFSALQQHDDRLYGQRVMTDGAHQDNAVEGHKHVLETLT